MPQASSPSSDRHSISELLQQLTRQSTELAQKEVELAKAEMTQKGKRLGLGAGAFSGAGLSPPIPEQTVESVKEDLRETKDKQRKQKHECQRQSID